MSGFDNFDILTSFVSKDVVDNIIFIYYFISRVYFSIPGLNTSTIDSKNNDGVYKNQYKLNLNTVGWFSKSYFYRLFLFFKQEIILIQLFDKCFTFSI